MVATSVLLFFGFVLFLDVGGFGIVNSDQFLYFRRLKFGRTYLILVSVGFPSFFNSVDWSSFRVIPRNPRLVKY